MLAIKTGVSELAINETESKELADAMQAVAGHYSDFIIDQRTQDWINLFMVMGGIYGPRGIAIWNNRKPKIAAPRPAEPVRVQVGTQVNGHAASHAARPVQDTPSRIDPYAMSDIDSLPEE